MKSRFPFIRQMALVGACGLLLAAFLGVHAATVHASPALLFCTIGTHTNVFDPGLKNQPQLVQATTTEDFDNCIAVGVSSLTAGDSTFTLSCLASVITPAPTVTYHWNNGASSTVKYTVETAEALADGSIQVTATGPVLSGYGAGSLATRVDISPQLDPLQCETPEGVTQVIGTETLAFV